MEPFDPEDDEFDDWFNLIAKIVIAFTVIYLSGHVAVAIYRYFI